MTVRADLCALIRRAEPDPARWLAAVVRIAEATGRVKPERLRILGQMSLDSAVHELVSEAGKQGLRPDDREVAGVAAVGP